MDLGCCCQTVKSHQTLIDCAGVDGPGGAPAADSAVQPRRRHLRRSLGTLPRCVRYISPLQMLPCYIALQSQRSADEGRHSEVDLALPAAECGKMLCGLQYDIGALLTLYSLRRLASQRHDDSSRHLWPRRRPGVRGNAPLGGLGGLCGRHAAARRPHRRAGAGRGGGVRRKLHRHLGGQCPEEWAGNAGAGDQRWSGETLCLLPVYCGSPPLSFVPGTLLSLKPTQRILLAQLI